MNEAHLGESIELYALGALDARESKAVSAHVATCTACTRLLGDAERTVAAMDALTVPQVAAPASLDARFARYGSARSSLQATIGKFERWGALAAALVLFVGGAFVASDEFRLRATIARDERPLRAILESHFTHVSFHSIAANAPNAKAIFGHGPHAWIYVIADSANCACHLVGTSATGESDLGALEPHGTTSTLFLSDAPSLSRIDLRTGAQRIATAKVARHVAR